MKIPTIKSNKNIADKTNHNAKNNINLNIKNGEIEEKRANTREK